MGIKELTGIRNEDGGVTLRCPRCGGSPEKQYGAQNRDQLAYVISCSVCHQILGEWTTAEDRDKDLREFVENVTSQ